MKIKRYKGRYAYYKTIEKAIAGYLQKYFYNLIYMVAIKSYNSMKDFLVLK